MAAKPKKQSLIRRIATKVKEAAVKFKQAAVGATPVIKQTAKSAYLKADVTLGGRLPGGKTPTEVKLLKEEGRAWEVEAKRRLERRKEVEHRREYIEEAASKHQLRMEKRAASLREKISEETWKTRESLIEAQQKALRDLYTKSWYEQIGISQSPYEQAVQQQMEAQALGEAAVQTGMVGGGGGTVTIEEKKQFPYVTMALIAAGALLAYGIFSKSKLAR